MPVIVAVVLLAAILAVQPWPDVAERAPVDEPAAAVSEQIAAAPPEPAPEPAVMAEPAEETYEAEEPAWQPAARAAPEPSLFEDLGVVVGRDVEMGEEGLLAAGLFVLVACGVRRLMTTTQPSDSV